MYLPWPRPLNPVYNLTLEEALYRACPLDTLEEALMLWINHTSVIIGRLSRDNLDYSCIHARELGIPVFRRFTGGGAVYHDHGVLSITIVGKRAPRARYVYDFGAGLIVKALSGLGIEARIANEGDVVVSNCKVAGSAAHIGKDRFLYHATLIVDADTDLIKLVTPPRWDRISRGEVDPVKYNPCSLIKLTRINIFNIYRIFVEIGDTYGKALTPLYNLLPYCPEAYKLQWILLKKRLNNRYWNPC